MFYFRYFQFKLLHRVLHTNELLYKWKVVTSDKCSFCNNAKETIVHLFFDCMYVRLFWLHVYRWYRNITGVNYPLSVKTIIFHDCTKSVGEPNLFNLIILIGKHYVYACRCLKTLPNLSGFLSKLENIRRIETSSGNALKGPLRKHVTKWSAL